MWKTGNRNSGLISRRALAGVVLLAALTTTVSAEPAVDAETADVARSLGRLDQSYTFRGLRSGHGSAATQGSSFGDQTDPADRAADQPGRPLPPGMQMLDVLPAEGDSPR